MADADNLSFLWYGSGIKLYQPEFGKRDILVGKQNFKQVKVHINDIYEKKLFWIKILQNYINHIFL